MIILYFNKSQNVKVTKSLLFIFYTITKRRSRTFLFHQQSDLLYIVYWQALMQHRKKVLCGKQGQTIGLLAVQTNIYPCQHTSTRNWGFASTPQTNIFRGFGGVGKLLTEKQNNAIESTIFFHQHYVTNKYFTYQQQSFALMYTWLSLLMSLSGYLTLYPPVICQVAATLSICHPAA